MSPRQANRRPRSKVRKIELAREYLIANPEASNNQASRELGCSIGTVSNARRLLITAGLVPKRYHDRRPDDTPGPTDQFPTLANPVDLQGAEELKQRLGELSGAAGEAHTPDEVKRRLSAIARNAALEHNGQLEIAALNALGRAEAQFAEKTTLGPPPPATDEEKIDRLSVLISCTDPKITCSALFRAFTEEEIAEFARLFSKMWNPAHNPPPIMAETASTTEFPPDATS